MSNLQDVLRFDENSAMLFESETEHTLAQAYERDFPQLQSRDFFPVSNEIPEGAETFRYEEYENVGVAKIISNYADDIPASDAKANEVFGKVRSLGSKFGYNVQEIRAASLAGKPLEARRAISARESIERLVDELAFTGDSTHMIPGFNTNANIPTGNVADNAAGTSTEWSQKTPDEQIKDVTAMRSTIITTTNGVERPRDLILPLGQHVSITQERIPDTSISIKDYLTRTLGSEVQVRDWWRLDAAGVSGASRMVMYTQDRLKLELHIPMEVMDHPVQRMGLKFEKIMESRFAGVHVYKPLSVLFRDGI